MSKREPPLDPQLRAQLLERLSHRADRLAKVTAATHPGHSIDAVVSLMAEHVAHTAMALLGETFARALWSRAFDDLSESFGMCRFCRSRPLREDRTMCQVCWDQAESDDAITDEELASLALDAEGAISAPPPEEP